MLLMKNLQEEVFAVNGILTIDPTFSEECLNLCFQDG